MSVITEYIDISKFDTSQWIGVGLIVMALALPWVFEYFNLVQHPKKFVLGVLFNVDTAVLRGDKHNMLFYQMGVEREKNQGMFLGFSAFMPLPVVYMLVGNVQKIFIFIFFAIFLASLGQMYYKKLERKMYSKVLKLLEQEPSFLDQAIALKTSKRWADKLKLFFQQV